MNQITPRRGWRPATPGFLRPPPAQTHSRDGGKLDPDVLALPSPDWLQQTVRFTGPAEQIAALKEAVVGSGNVPWVYHYERMEEDWFHRLATGRNRMKIGAARILARQLRDATWEMHERAVADDDISRACPFDLHALCAVPWEVLRLGPDDPASMRWCWQNWGSTWPLRRVEVMSDKAAAWTVRFCSADWTPWPVLTHIKEQRSVEFQVRLETA